MNAHTRKHTDKTYTHIAPAPRYKLTHREKMGRVSQKNWVFRGKLGMEDHWEGRAGWIHGLFLEPIFFLSLLLFFFSFFQCLSRLLTKRRVNAARIANVVLQLPEREWKEVVGLIVCL